MTESVFQFKAIARRLNCNDQKADFEEKNPKPVVAAMPAEKIDMHEHLAP